MRNGYVVLKIDFDDLENTIAGGRITHFVGVTDDKLVAEHHCQRLREETPTDKTWAGVYPRFEVRDAPWIWGTEEVESPRD